MLSDLGAIRHLYDRHLMAATPKDAVCRALNSGVDMQFYDFDHATFQGAIRQGSLDGRSFRSSRPRCAAAFCASNFYSDLFDHPMVDATLNARVQRTRLTSIFRSNRRAESMTLLRNRGHLLPLVKSYAGRSDRPQRRSRAVWRLFRREARARASGASRHPQR